MDTYHVYEMRKRQDVLLESSKDLNKLCEKYEIPKEEAHFKMRICNGEFSHNQYLICREKNGTMT